jgi:hypothetical protein
MELGDMAAIQRELDEDAYLSRRLGLGPEPPSNPGSQDMAFDAGSKATSLEGITSRKAPVRGGLDGGSSELPYDVDDNKYDKHPIGQLWKNITTYALTHTHTHTHTHAHTCSHVCTYLCG